MRLSRWHIIPQLHGLLQIRWGPVIDWAANVYIEDSTFVGGSNGISECDDGAEWCFATTFLVTAVQDSGARTAMVKTLLRTECAHGDLRQPISFPGSHL